MHVNAMTIPINPMRSTVLRAVQRSSASFTLTTPRISFSPSPTLVNIIKNNNATAPLTTIRSLSNTAHCFKQKKQKLAHNNEPIPDSPPTTDFSEMDMLGQTPIPSTAIDECFHDGFALNSGVQITGGSGVLLVGGEAFEWRPWLVSRGGAGVGAEGEGMGTGGDGMEQVKGGGEKRRKLVNEKGQWVLEKEEQWGFLGRLWPRPDLLILGVGPSLRPLSPATRALINSMGIRVEVLDTRNAASQYNLLATERGVDQVAAALVPLGWRE